MQYVFGITFLWDSNFSLLLAIYDHLFFRTKVKRPSFLSSGALLSIARLLARKFSRSLLKLMRRHRFHPFDVVAKTLTPSLARLFKNIDSVSFDVVGESLVSLTYDW